MSSNSNDINQDFLKNLYQEHGKDLLTLEKCLEIKNKLLGEQAAILKEVLVDIICYRTFL